MNKTLRIATWNANGLFKHIPDLEIFLNDKKIDICLISETHFTRTSYVKIRGYCSYHTPHLAEKAKGGAAIFIKENIKHHEEIKIQKEAI